MADEKLYIDPNAQGGWVTSLAKDWDGTNKAPISHPYPPSAKISTGYTASNSSLSTLMSGVDSYLSGSSNDVYAA